MTAEECPFCNLNTERNRVLKEGKLVHVIVSNPSLMQGHTLVLPKRHVSMLAELTVDERAELLETAIHFQQKIKTVFQSGCDLLQHDRPFMPATKVSVPGHLHVHLRPRQWKDPFYTKVAVHETPLFYDVPEHEMRKVLRLLGE
jgi:diadenosine tetraphosphate (Ap4A) HIT family hydrolase